MLRVVLASGARLGSPFEQAWGIAACAALFNMTDAEAEAAWAKIRADQEEWREAYGWMRETATASANPATASVQTNGVPGRRR